MSKELLDDKLRAVRLLVLDIDGVLTDGRVYIGSYGDDIRSFHIQDGFGLVQLKKQGIPFAVISGKKSKANDIRMKDLGPAKMYQNVSDKGKYLKKIMRKCRVKPEEVCYVGDDIIDLPAMRMVGCAIAVQNAVEDVKRHAHWVTRKNGGEGAVREVVELILRAQNKWTDVLKRFGVV